MKLTDAKEREQEGIRHRKSSQQFLQAREDADQSGESHVSVDVEKVIRTGTAPGMTKIMGKMSTHDTSDDQALSKIIDIQQLDTSKSAKELETDYNNMELKIHSFPASLQGVGERYIRPKLVTIGPYHTKTNIIDQEVSVKEMKEAAMRSFVVGRSESKKGEVSIKKSIEKMFMKVSRTWHMGDATSSGVTGDPIEGRVDVRSLYDKNRIPRQVDDERVVYNDLFTMFRDGCFLLQFIRMCTISDPGLPKWLDNWFDVNKSLICSDIMLLENQLPWVVLETLMESSRPKLRVPLDQFVAKMGRSLQVRKDEHNHVPSAGYKPPHLLGYLWHYKTGGSIQEPVSVGLMPMSKTVSVIELADIGIYLTSSKTTQFKDMGITSWCTGPGNISLAPLLLDEVTSCWLVNMVAFEVCVASITKNRVVSSYLALLAMLMDGEQDVHELRANRIVQGDLTNKEILDFFKTLSKHIRPGHLYFHIMEQIESFRVSRFVWSIFHRLLYNSFSKRSFKYNYTKTIMTAISFVAALVAIFKVIFVFHVPHT